MLLCQPAIHVRQASPLQSGSAVVPNTHTDSCARHMSTDDDSTPRSSGRVAARRVSSESTDGDADGLQWGAVRGRRGGANPAASARIGQTPPAAGALPWGNGMGAPTPLWRLALLLRYCSFSSECFVERTALPTLKLLTGPGCVHLSSRRVWESLNAHHRSMQTVA